jgi:hypothetical protein
MEWREEDARRFAGDSRLLWDAANTPDGLAGYITVEQAESCSVGSVRLYPSLAFAHRYREILPDADPGQSEFYRVARRESGGRRQISAEFVLPWDDIKTDSLGGYTIAAVAITGCDTLGPILVTGVRYSPIGEVFTPNVRFRMGIIAALLVAYIFLNMSVRKKRGRKADPAAM